MANLPSRSRSRMQTSEASKVSSIKSARLWSNCSTSLAAVAERAIRLMSSIWRMRRRSLEYSRAFSTATAAWPAKSASSPIMESLKWSGSSLPMLSTPSTSSRTIRGSASSLRTRSSNIT